ncbi:MAG: YkvA family protein [Salinibacter sp.]|uniref:YkvA family protein n=1 Tax=Salinibacter sp. TaxID=2065818 RepID=UPI0035D3E81A
MDDEASERNVSERRRDFYESIRQELEQWMRGAGDDHEYERYILLAPDLFYLLDRLSREDDLPPEHEADVDAALSYFMSSMDIVPEGIVGPPGYVDDIAVSAHVVRRLLESVDADVVRRNWSGDEDLEEVVENILEFARYSMGTDTWEQVKRDFDSDA